MFYKKGVFKNFSKFTGKHLCQSLLFNKVAGLRPVTLLKMRLWYRCSPVNFEKSLRKPFFYRKLPGDCFCSLFRIICYSVLNLDSSGDLNLCILLFKLWDECLVKCQCYQENGLNWEIYIISIYFWTWAFWCSSKIFLQRLKLFLGKIFPKLISSILTYY